MYRGDSYPILITVTDSVTRQPVNLTGATLIMTVDASEAPESTDTQLFQITGVIDEDDPTSGRVIFTPSISNTDLPRGKYFYDISLTSPSITKKTIVKNTFNILMDIGKD